MNRFCFGAILFAGLGVLLGGCGSNTDVSTIQITPATQALAAGQAAQFTATGIISHGKHPASTQDVTTMVSWASNAPAIATISSSGMVTAVSAGTTTITASMPSAVSATATVTVTGGGGGSGSADIVSLSILPGSQAVQAPDETSQFLAIGTTAGGATENLTTRATWISSSTSVATVNPGGLVTAVGKGTANLTAIVTNADNSVATGTATFTVATATSEPMTALTITPTSEALSASGQSGQFSAIGTLGTAGITADLTNSPHLAWTSSIPSVAFITSGLSTGNGVVSGASVGTTTISAMWTNPDKSVLLATADVTVSLTAPPNPLLSLSIIPNTISISDLQGTGQFLAIGTFAKPPYIRDVTNSANTTWISSFPDDFPVNSNSGGTSSASAGIVTAYASGSATIIAEYTDPDSLTIQTATATFNCPLVIPDPTTHPPTPPSCYYGQGGPLKATLTVYGEGLNISNWLITAPSATGTPDVIHCGPGWAVDGHTDGSVCVGIYPLLTGGQPTTITLTAHGRPGVAFGGWTYNCIAQTVTETGDNTCTIQLISHDGGSVNATVGAIFNNTAP
ncbi:MAG TPA: Ig-like domain-containing protein [Terracidiphilus sp.]